MREQIHLSLRGSALGTVNSHIHFVLEAQQRLELDYLLYRFRVRSSRQYMEHDFEQ